MLKGKEIIYKEGKKSFAKKRKNRLPKRDNLRKKEQIHQKEDKLSTKREKIIYQRARGIICQKEQKKVFYKESDIINHCPFSRGSLLFFL